MAPLYDETVRVEGQYSRQRPMAQSCVSDIRPVLSAPASEFPNSQWPDLRFDFRKLARSFEQGCSTSVWTGPGPNETDRSGTESSRTATIGSTRSSSQRPIGSVQLQDIVGPTDWTEIYVS